MSVCVCVMSVYVYVYPCVYTRYICVKRGMCRHVCVMCTPGVCIGIYVCRCICVYVRVRSRHQVSSPIK